MANIKYYFKSVNFLMIEEKIAYVAETRCGKNIVLRERAGLGFAG